MSHSHSPVDPLQGRDRDLVGRGVLTPMSLPRDGKRPGQSLTSRSGELGEGRVAEIQEEAYARVMRGACETGRERCGIGHTKTRAAHGPVLRSWDPTLPREPWRVGGWGGCQEPCSLQLAQSSQAAGRVARGPQPGLFLRGERP